MLDNSREVSSFSVITGEVTAVSLPGLLSDIADFRAAVGNITLGVQTQDALRAYADSHGNTPPANELADVETAWLVTYEDTLEFFDDPVNAIPNEGFGKLFTLTVPTADVVGKLQANSDKANLAQADIAAFVTAFEAMARSPYGGTVNVIEMTRVGRKR